MANGRFLDPLRGEFLGDDEAGRWRLLEPFQYYRDLGDGREVIVVPAGFITDFASVPRVLWAVFPPTGAYGKAAVIHDYLYRYPVLTVYRPNWPDRLRRLSRAECDGIFREGMVVLGVSAVTRWMMYPAVRLGGGVPWSRYRATERLLRRW